MSCYKILGIFSFADNLIDVKINDSVILKNEKCNIKSKNAIGVYLANKKKIGYLPIEDKNELIKFKHSYKICKLQLNQSYPLVEINREYININNIVNYDFSYIKTIKYDNKIIDIPESLLASLKNVVFTLKHKKINVKQIIITHQDINYINLIIKTTKDLLYFYTVTYKYFQENKDIYEELFDLNLIEHLFYKELLFHRPEKYFEINYTHILNYELLYKYNFINITTYDKIYSSNKNIDIIYFTRLYLNCLINNNFEYIIKYLNKCTKLENNIITLNDIIDIIDTTVLNNINTNYELSLGGFYYDHTKKIYSEIDFITDDSIFIISENILNNYALNCYLTKKKYIKIYNPLTGTININETEIYL
jgi:hypothetical protein